MSRIGRRDLLWLTASAALPARAAEAAQPFEMSEVAPGLFVRVGVIEEATADNADAIANIGFAVGREAVAVIDPGGSLADGMALRAAIRERTVLPIRYVISSHVHPDHILGGPAFLHDAPAFIGHAALPAAVAGRGMFYRDSMRALLGELGGAAVMPTRTVITADSIDLGGRVLELRAHGPAHSTNDLTVIDRATGTLWAADLVFVTRTPSLDGSVRGWLRELGWLCALPAARAVPGHGPACVAWPEGADSVRRYLVKLAADVRDVLARGGDLDEALASAAQSERDSWRLFEAYNGHNIAHAMHELEWENAQ